MPKLISLNARRVFQAQQTGDVAIGLITFRHETLYEPVRLSTDPTVRLSTDPLIFGTRHQGDEYLFALVDVIVPDDQQEASPTASIVFSNVDADMAAQFRAILTPPRVDLAIVLKSDPDAVMVPWSDLRCISAAYDQNQITVEISREPLTSEPWPAGRMTRSRFPALHR